MRLGGAFPLPVTDIYSSGGVLSLTSGEAFYLPSGMYELTAGSVTTLQSFDPVAGQWRGFTGILGPNDEISVPDGFNCRLINLSGTITGATISNAGSGATNGIGATATGVTIAFGGPASPGVTATAYPIVGGSVAAPTVAQAGTGFLVPPIVVIDPPPFGGIQATAHAVLTAPGGGISSIVMDNVGAGYVNVPTFYLIPQPQFYQGAGPGGTTAGAFPPPGLVAAQNAPQTGSYSYNVPTTAAGTASLNAATLTGSGTLTGIVMTGYGSNYSGTTIPVVTITGCGAAAATAVGWFVVTGVTVGAGGATYTGAAPLWETSLGLVTTTLNNNALAPRAARGICVTNAGAVTGFTIEDQGAGFQKVPTVVVINAGSIATVIATGTAVIGGVQDTTLIQSKISG